jgi:hypothetical protein
MSDDPDDELMAGLRRIAAELDPVPERVADGARAALSTRRLDEELAVLLIDSAVRADLVRGVDEARLLSFGSARVTVELQVEPAGAEFAVRGLVTGTAGSIVVESRDGRQVVTVDDEGWFGAEVPPGVMRIRLRDTDGRAVATSWVLL